MYKMKEAAYEDKPIEIYESEKDNRSRHMYVLVEYEVISDMCEEETAIFKEMVKNADNFSISCFKYPYIRVVFQVRDVWS